MTKKILLTGATGFLGRHLVQALRTQYSLCLPVRNPSNLSDANIKTFNIDAIDGTTDWSHYLNGCNVVIHTAARVHVMNDEATDPLAEFRKINVDGTLHLARQAASLGVKRFIFISSIKVNGEESQASHPFKADDKPNPQDPYALSKYEAEQGLLDLARETGMEIVIIRPPLVYGPAVKGNFKKILRTIKHGIPLPLGRINNKRSLVFVGNLIDLIQCCINHPKAANQIFLVSDDHDLSTTELFLKTSQALAKSAFLFPIPPSLLTFLASCLGKKSMAKRLLGSLEVDISKTKSRLDWKPPISVEEGLRKTVEGFGLNKV